MRSGMLQIGSRPVPVINETIFLKSHRRTELDITGMAMMLALEAKTRRERLTQAPMPIKGVKVPYDSKTASAVLYMVSEKSLLVQANLIECSRSLILEYLGSTV